MTTTTGRFDALQSSGGALQRGWTVLGWVLGWPARVYRVRQMMHDLAGLDDHELRDIGLTRLDLAAASALAPDADPSLALKRRVEERRRR